MKIIYRRSLQVVAEPDVLVYGVGCAGLVDAVISARKGASTMAVESSVLQVASSLGLCRPGRTH